MKTFKAVVIARGETESDVKELLEGNGDTFVRVLEVSPTSSEAIREKIEMLAREKSIYLEQANELDLRIFDLE